jgi:hypothetical protein
MPHEQQKRPPHAELPDQGNGVGRTPVLDDLAVLETADGDEPVG